MSSQRFPSLIQRIPRGLLSFLDVKAGGDYPVNFITQLQPTLDLMRFYANGEAQHYTAGGIAIGSTASGTKLPFTNTTVTDLTNGANLIVPQNETWMLLDATTEMNFNLSTAGDIFDVALQIGFNSTATRFVIPAQTLQGNPYLGVTGNVAYRSLNEPQFIMPGNELALRVIRCVAAAGTPFGAVCRLRLLRFNI